MSRKSKSYKENAVRMMVEFLEKDQVFQEWDLRIKKIKKVGHDYKIKTQRGEKLLKVGFEEDRILFMHLALEHLVRHGCFRGIPRFIPTKYGDYYVKTDLGIYYLTDWIEGKEGKTKELKHVLSFVKLLAEIHLAGVNFQPVPYWASGERYDDISCHMAEKINKVNENLDKLPGELRDAWLSYETIAQEAQNLLKVSGYHILQETAQTNMTLCHRRFVPRNGIITKGKGTASMLCWEHCAYGVQVGDLIYFLGKVMPSFDWNYNAGEQIIKAYHLIRPLSREELMTLGAALMFPAAFIKVVEKFIKGKLEQEKINSKLKKVKIQDERKNSFLEEFFGIAGCAFWQLGEEDPQIWDMHVPGFVYKKSMDDDEEE
ncbi:MAG TPA: hypothetical protein GXZ75_01555 [Clostridia bacterium]|nr:hypothetical protein [Clostridia bacterium]